MNQRLTWTALPNGIIDRHGSKMLRLSVRMTPRLTPDGESSPIDQFDDFKVWSEKPWSFSVLFGDYPTSGPVVPTFTNITPAENVLLDPDLWQKLFIEPKPVLVRNRVPGDYSKAKLRSFPASRVLDVIRKLYTQVAFETPTEMPPPSWLYGRRENAESEAKPWSSLPFRLLNLSERDRLKKQIDDMISKNHVMPHTYPESVNEATAIQYDFFQAEYFHAPKTKRGVDRYYDIKTERPDPDFHQIVALLSDYPVLMRKLGLIFDLEVPVPANIASVSEKIVRIWPENPLAGDTSADVRENESKIALATRYDFRPALNVFCPLTSGTLIKNGYLDLSGSDFSITQVDVDGSAIKAINFAETLASLTLKKPVLGTPQTAGLPALRSGGLSVMMDNRAADLLAKIKNGAAFESLLATPNQWNSIRFNAEDLIRGNCIDICDETNGIWRSLCKRAGTYLLDSGTGSTENIVDEKDCVDEGTVTVAVTSSSDPDMPKDLYLHEALFHWNGWSLVVQPPGQSIGKPEKKNVSNVSYEPTELNNITGLSTSFTVPTGTLPKLRYGRSYRMRARVVDIAGNSLAFDDKNESCATASAPYLRFEPVPSPALISVSNLPPASDPGLRPGESADCLVIRSEAGKESIATDETTSRVILPPRTAVEIAGLHGMLDTPPPSGCAATWYEELSNRDAATIGSCIASDTAMNEAPYLPDPLAKGATFIGLPGVDAPFMFQTSFNATCAWPHAATFAIELREGEAGYEWREEARKLVVTLPKAERITVRMSSNLGDASALAQMGIWQWIEEAAPAGWVEKLSKVAVEGRHWMLTPFRELTLVHAVQKPLAAPSVQGPSPSRGPGDTFCTLTGVLQVHGKSTDKVDFQATWNDIEPAPDKPDGFSLVARKGDAASFQVADPDSIAVPLAVRHELGDTKHRRIAYHATATTRFREYFESKDATPVDFINPSTTDRPADFVLDVPSSARPLAPVIEYIIPSFDWKEERKDDGVFRTRGGNSLRVYMSGEWFSSGEGELLGVVLAHGPQIGPSDGLNSDEKSALLGQAAPVPPDTLKVLVTRWGADPIRITGAVHQTPSVHHFPAATARATDLILDENPVLPSAEPFWGVAVAGHPVAYDSERKLWYCDVVIDAGPSYFPFVRLALARYQPCSVAGTELSRVIVADCVQTAPDRLLWTSADPNNPFGVRVSLSGVAPRFNGNIACPNRVIVRVEVCMPGADAPVWVPVDAPWTALSEMQVSKTVAVWSGEVLLPQVRGSQRYRLVVEEYEFLNTDPDRGLVNNNAMQLRSMVNIGKSAVWPRIVYSDIVELDASPAES